MQKLPLRYTVIWDVLGPLFQTKLHLLSAVLPIDFKAPMEFWNLLSKARLAGLVNATVYKPEPIYTLYAHTYIHIYIEREYYPCNVLW